MEKTSKLFEAKLDSNLPDIKFGAVFSVSDNGSLELECGARTLNTLPLIQKCPVLPLKDPVPLPHLPLQGNDEEGEETGFSGDLIKNQLDDGKMDLCRIDPVHEAFLNEEQFRKATDKYVKSKVAMNFRSSQKFWNEKNLLRLESYGKGNLFNGSCVQIIDNFVFYTGNDGFLRISRVDETEENLDVLDIKISDTDLDHTRIYSIDVLKCGSSFLISARYKSGISYWSFDGTNCTHIARFPQSVDCIGHSFLNSSKAVHLDIKSDLSLVDIQSGKVIMRKAVNIGGEDYSWGIVSQGRGLNNVCVGSRKNIALVDIRSENYESICHLEDRVYLRDITTILPNLYLTTDQALLVYDIRNTKQSIQSVNLNFSPYSVVYGSDVVNVDGEHWCLTTTDKGEIGISVFDYSHKTCSTNAPKDENIQQKCNSSKPKLPDAVCSFKRMKGWKETVARARLNAGFWLEHSVENRFKIDFRGGSLQMVPEDQSLRAVLVNGVGDLFYTCVQKKVQEDDFLESNELIDFQFDGHHDEILEEWGQKIYKDTPVKKVFVRKIFSGVCSPNSFRDNLYGMPEIDKEWVGQKNSIHVKIQPDEFYHNSTTIPEMRTIVERVYEDINENENYDTENIETENADSGNIKTENYNTRNVKTENYNTGNYEVENDETADANNETEANEVEHAEDVGNTQVRCISFDQYPDGSVSQKIIHILMQKGEDTPKSEAGDPYDNADNLSVYNPESPSRLYSFLEDLGADTGKVNLSNFDL